jgi:16S rRNA G527 N7-methylase RsmG
MDPILNEGIQYLCEADPAVSRIITPRAEAVLGLLEKYIAEIELFNPVYSLVGAKDRGELVTKHILDS